MMGMDAYLWTNRPLLVFAPSREHPFFAAQQESLYGHAQALSERDVVVVEIAGDRVLVDGEPAPDLHASKLRQRYVVDQNEAAVLLVGKDGGLKVKKSEVFLAEELFETIDAMPMRLQEMRERDGMTAPKSG